MTKPKKPKKATDKPIVIEGVTPEGKVFRPSDWAERMSGSMASFKNSRIHYSPLLQPTVNHAGYKCVVLDPKLKESSPQIYQSILDFAKANQLNICDQTSDESDASTDSDETTSSL
jgi:hypothetical protein